MIKEICDRCGKEIPRVSPMANVCTPITAFPMVDMTVREQWNFDPKRIDLCHDCRVAIMNFINSKEGR